MADIRRAARSVAKKGELQHDDLAALATELWSKPVFERRITAAILLDLHVDALSPDYLPLIERLIRESKTWALVDELAGNVVGGISLKHPIKRHMDRWAKDQDFWIRRSSLLAELKPLKNGASLGPFLTRADAMLEETEFFIRKAIGWVLREVSKKRPDEVYDWIAPRTDRASGVTVREVVKYLDTARAKKVMKAYKEKRPVLSV